MDERLSVHASTASNENRPIPVMGVFEADIAGEEMFDTFKTGVSRHFAYLDDILVVETIMKVGMQPFHLLRKNQVVLKKIGNDKAKYETALANFETSTSNAFNYHREQHESVALQLFDSFC